MLQLRLHAGAELLRGPLRPLLLLLLLLQLLRRDAWVCSCRIAHRLHRRLWLDCRALLKRLHWRGGRRGSVRRQLLVEALDLGLHSIEVLILKARTRKLDAEQQAASPPVLQLLYQIAGARHRAVA